MTSGAADTEMFESLPAPMPVDIPGDLPDVLPVAVVDDAGTVHYWSSGCTALYGWSGADALGTVKYELLRSSLSGRPAPWTAPIGGAARALAEIHRDGHCIRVLEQIVPLKHAGFHALYMMEDNAHADRTTDDSIRMAIALDMGAIGIVGYDVPARRLEWSQPGWPSLGSKGGFLSLDQVLAGGLGPLSGKIVAICQEALREGRDEVELELPIHGRTIGLRTIRGKVRLVRNAQGAIDRFIGVIQDLTAADIRERTLRDREAELRGILETVTDAMVVVDCDGTISAFSRAAQELLGYDSPSMIGKPIAPLLDGRWFDIMAAAVGGGAHERRVIDAKGQRLPVELRMAALPSDDASGHILFLTDISKRRAAEARRTMFEHAARDIAMAEFAVHLMHELNQPLAAASNFLAVAQQLATESERFADTGEMIGMALGQIQRLGGIVRSTQRKASGEDMDPRPVQVRAAIDEAVALVRFAGGDHGVEIAIDVHSDAKTMFVDPIGNQQVLANLLRNAVEAFGPAPCQGARIDVRSRRTDKRLLLSVCDNGPGIPPSTMADLFEPFRQSAKKGGMGLGLSICRTIAEAHGGTLGAENLPGGGACFTLALPLHDRDDMA